MLSIASRVAWFVAVSTAVAAPAYAQQDWRVPLDFTSGLLANGPGPRPFAGGARLGVLRGFDGARLRFGVAGAALYTRGAWAGFGGLRAGLRAVGVVDAGLYAYAEALVGDGLVPLSLGVVGELPVGVSLRTGLWATWDPQGRMTTLTLLLGTDLAFWFGRKGPPGPRRPGDTP